MQKTIIVASIALITICSVMSCRYVMPERYVDYNKGRVPVNLPHDAKNADIDSNADRSNAVIVTVTSDGQAYLGTDHSPLNRDELKQKLRELAAKQSEEDRMVYLSVDVAADYGAVVEVCDAIRTADVSRVGVLAFNPRHDWPARITVELPPQPNPNEDLSHLKPNPLILVTAINPDLGVTLNTDPMGAVNDLDPLNQKLQQIFRLREEQYALKPGYETRTDLPVSERTEKTLTIKAPRRVKYGDLVKVIDAAKGAGASPIVLQLDDLPN